MLEKCHHFQGFPQAVYTWGDLLPLIWEEDKALMGGTDKGGREHRPYGGTDKGGREHRPYGGPNSDRLYHKLKVLQLLLSCNYTMQFVSYDSIKLIDLYLIAFKFAQ